MAQSLARVLLSVALVALCGCAKSPSGGATTSGGDLLVTMTVAGTFNPSYYYFVVFNTSNDPNGTAGPDPVIAPPWGNGFVAGTATQFVEFTGSIPNGQVYNFVPGSSLQQYTPLATPTQSTPLSASTNTLEFRIPLSYLATSAISTASITNIQINFLTTDRLPVNPQDTTPKLFDALGDSAYGSGQLNDFITISTTQGATYNNSYENIEPEGDVQQTNGSGGYSTYPNQTQPPASSLDIVGWSVQVER